MKSDLTWDDIPPSEQWFWLDTVASSGATPSRIAQMALLLMERMDRPSPSKCRDIYDAWWNRSPRSGLERRLAEQHVIRHLTRTLAREVPEGPPPSRSTPVERRVQPSSSCSSGYENESPRKQHD